MPTYRGNGAWGTGKGSNLTEAEFDGNTNEFDVRITSLEDDPPEAVSIMSVTISGTELTFHLTDGSTLDPFDISIPYPRFMGEWVASAMYAALDQFTVAGQGLYMVLADHVADSTFDPAALGGDVTAGDFAVNRAYVITAVGTTDFTLIGASANTIGVEFTATGVGSGTGTAAQRLYFHLMGDGPLTPPTYTVPVTGDTITALTGEQRQIVDPAGAIDALSIVLPPTPADGDKYWLLTTQTITSIDVSGADTETVIGDSFGLDPGGKARWVYSDANTTWYGETPSLRTTCSAGTVALDGSNPTSVAHGLGTCLAVSVQLMGSSAPGVGASVLTAVINGDNIDVYAWKPTSNSNPTLIASTGTEDFTWIARGV